MLARIKTHGDGHFADGRKPAWTDPVLRLMLDAIHGLGSRCLGLTGLADRGDVRSSRYLFGGCGEGLLVVGGAEVAQGGVSVAGGL